MVAKDRNSALTRRGACGAIAGAALTASLAPSVAWAESRPQQMLEKARIAVTALMADDNFPQLGAFIREAKAVLIVPELLKGGFILGGEGGSGVLVVRGPDGVWGYPVFYNMGGGSIGAQIGGQVSQLVLTIMREEGLDALLRTKATAGVDFSVAAAKAGVGYDARTGVALDADMYAFSRNQGLYLGGALEGNVFVPRKDWNDLFYEVGATTLDIIDGRYPRTQADRLRAVLP
ncbi:MAG: lipid-binding SYLF domain-containing protein [Pseudomonadota bacterium]